MLLTETDVSVGSIGCEALQATAEALAEYNATVNCAFNSIRNCQKGAFDTVVFDQKGNANINVSSNNTNAITNKFTNQTTQSLTAVTKQFDQQVQSYEASLQAWIAGGSAGSPPQGPRQYTEFAADISNLTANVSANSIQNDQIVSVIQTNELDIPLIVQEGLPRLRRH